jgi:hypothetical protein
MKSTEIFDRRLARLKSAIHYPRSNRWTCLDTFTTARPHRNGIPLARLKNTQHPDHDVDAVAKDLLEGMDVHVEAS